MKTQLLISIIVPIYNVEKYVNRCVKSLIDQTYENIEIILIDDGSTDQCPEICDCYAKRDKRIQTIHKQNGGLSDARNVGISKAKGNYILFVDSDDYLETEACKEFVRIIGNKKPDIVVGGAKKIDKNKIILQKHTYNTNAEMVTGEQYLKKELLADSMYSTVWQNIYNREFIIGNRLFFKKGLLHEDELFTPIAFLKAKKVIGSDIIFYNYMIRENSITTQKKKLTNVRHLMQTLKELEKVYSQVKDEELKKLLNDSLVEKFLSIYRISDLNDKEYASLFDKKFLYKKAYKKKNKLKVLLFRISKRLYLVICNIYKNDR